MGGGILILITGITGLIMRALLGLLRESGYHGLIRCLVREHSDISRCGMTKRFYLRRCERCMFLLPVFNGVDGVIHLVNIRFSPRLLRLVIFQELKDTNC